MITDDVKNDYFNWLYDLVCKARYPKQISYRKLFICLHDIEFRYSIQKDKNRARDGIDLRYRYALFKGNRQLEEYLDGPCSVLEMMVALSVRCEETIMDDPNVGDRTSQWFWGMLVNLGLASMIDERFNKDYVENRIEILLDRKYEPNGKGGLFLIRNCDKDLRKTEIWYQLCQYLDSIT